MIYAKRKNLKLLIVRNVFFVLGFTIYSKKPNEKQKNGGITMNTTNNTKEEATFNVIYRMINSKANSNAFIQGVTGIAGFPSTLVIDGIVIFTHYEPLINDIRKLYGRSEITSKDLSPMMGNLVKELLFDIVVDKVMGHVPVAGAYFNAISAKALTWRLGMLVTVLSSRGEEFNKDNISSIIKLIRYVTPLNDLLKLKKPDYEVFKKIAISVSGNAMSEFDNKVQTALRAFE